jgi:hypothetical protein
MISDFQEIMENLQAELFTILKKAYQDCFQKWQWYWEWYINAGSTLKAVRLTQLQACPKKL